MVIGSLYRFARLHRLEELIPWNRFLGSLTINNSGYAAADRQSAGHVVSTKNVSYIDCRPNTLYSLAGCNMLSGGSYSIMILERLWYRTDCVVRGCTFSCTGPSRAAQQIFRYKWGAAGWGELHMFMFDWSALMTPQRATLDPACVHFRDLYPIDVLHLNFNNILCLLLL
jgi:hypothetical protein